MRVLHYPVYAAVYHDFSANSPGIEEEGGGGGINKEMLLRHLVRTALHG